MLTGVPKDIGNEAIRKALLQKGLEVDENRRGGYEAFVIVGSPLQAQNAINEGRIHIEDENFSLRVEKPRTRGRGEVLCFRCSEYGHFQSECKAEQPKCGHCSGTHHKRHCKAREEASKCVNCDEQHPAGARDCQVRVEAKATQLRQSTAANRAASAQFRSHSSRQR